MAEEIFGGMKMTVRNENVEMAASQFTEESCVTFGYGQGSNMSHKSYFYKCNLSIAKLH